MANEITIRGVITASKGGAKVSGDKRKVITMTGSAMVQTTQSVGTSAEQVVFGDIASAPRVLITNLDGTNYVELGLDSGVSTQVFCKLLAGECALIPLKSLTLYAKANTAACLISVVAVDL